jgi:ATP-binding cassette, subfamily B, bacterial MsbA
MSSPAIAAAPVSAADSKREKFDKKAAAKDTVRLIRKYGRPYLPLFALAFICLIGAGGLALFYPYFVGKLLGSVFTSREAGQLNWILKILIVILCVQSAFSFGRTYLLNYIGERLVSDVRQDLYSHLLRLSVNFFANRRTGELTSRIASDVTTIQSTSTTSLAEALRQTINFIGGSCFMFWINWKLSCLLLGLIPLMVLSFAIFGRNIRRRSTKVQDALAEANAILDETIAGIRTVQSFARERYEVNRYDSHIRRSLREALRRAVARGAFNALIVLVLFGGFVVLLWYSGNQVINGSLSAEQLIQFLFYTAWVGGSLGSLSEFYGEFNQAIGASRRVVELFNTPPEIADAPNATAVKDVRGLVEVQNVTFSYPGRPDARVLDGVSITARPGEVIALVGPSGAGKSTLISLIPRFYDVTGGAIAVDGLDIRNWKLHDLRENIGIVPQETTLFSGTIYDNITYGNLNATPAQIEAAARAAHAHDFIMAFPDKYQSVVGERGVKLSGGQRQRVAIARALLKDPRILILDEATSSLDSESERLVQEALDRLMEGRTTFVIAHRLSTVQRATKILVINGGRIVEAGSHHELLERDGIYKKLYKLQFRDVPSWLMTEQGEQA